MKIEFPPDVNKNASGGNFISLEYLHISRIFLYFARKLNIMLIIDILLIFIDKMQINQLVYLTFIKEKYKRIYL